MFKLLLSVFCFLFCVINAEDYSTNESVLLLQEYVQINTTTNNDLGDAVDFWTRLASEVNIPMTVEEFTEGYPVIVLTWLGSDPSLSGIMLNSHMDVVPASEEEGWTYPPFSATLDSDGVIWGRGTQDMKSVAIQYYSALKNLAANESTLSRNVYMTLMPDEEVGGPSGMIPFLKSDLFKSLNVGFELDEGTAYPLTIIPMFYQDKVVWQIQVDCYGAGGHSSTLPAINTTAIGKCTNVINSMLEYRQEQYEISLTAPINNAGIYTGVNLNIVSGGTANNVIPTVISLIFDIRLATTANETQFQEKLENLIYANGDNITITYLSKDEQSPATVVSTSNPYLVAMMEAAEQTNLTILPIVPPGSTDARHVRDVEIPAFGISPMPNTPLLLHSVNERLSASTFLTGITFYENAIKNLANLASDVVSVDPSTYIVDTQEDI